MADRPLVSVIIPVYNCERYLSEAIESVLDQSYRPIEVIVVDDGSTDRSGDIAKSFAPFVTYSHQRNLGVVAARNKAMSLALGSFFAYLDADDLWLKNKLTLQMAAFDAEPELDVVSGQVKQFFSPNLDEATKQKTRCPTELMPGYLPSAMVITRECISRVGPTATHIGVGEFMDWYMRAVEKGLRIRILPDLVTMRRIHESNQGIRCRGDFTQRLQILKVALDRRRAAKL